MISLLIRDDEDGSTIADLTLEEADVRLQTAEPERVWIRRFDPDFSMEPHPSPRSQIVVTLSGRAEVKTSDGRVREFGPGDVVIYEDTGGYGHSTRVVGGSERVTLIIDLLTASS